MGFSPKIFILFYILIFIEMFCLIDMSIYHIYSGGNLIILVRKCQENKNSSYLWENEPIVKRMFYLVGYIYFY
jgi:hypothetical protein